MTPELTADSPGEASKQAPSTAGMTTKVVKGSIWTLAGSVAPLAVSFISTPFIIRFLGTESYGVLLLVGLIPTYFSFADFGMGVASTKFASEAYGQGDEKKEAEVVWTATAIAAISALIVAIPIFLFSYPIVKLMNVPEHLLSTASIALKITSGSFFLGILSSVLNSPMLARLRMDLNMLTSALPKILLAAVTPFILYFGGGIVEAVGWAFIVAVGTAAVVVSFSATLLPELGVITANRSYITPLVKYGGAWFVAVVAGILIGNLEKFVLTSLVSVQALAYYSIAFTFANLATLFSQAMLQSLLPAFSQMMSVERREELNALVARGSRLTITALLPVVVFLFAVGGPFLGLWAGAEFGRESTVPFYILLGGFTLSIFSVLPFSVLLAAGRTNYFAKMYWIELPFYAALTWFLVSRFGIVGAAIAYAIRTVFDAAWASLLCRRVMRLHYGLTPYVRPILLAALVILPTVVVVTIDAYSPWLVPVAMISFMSYGLIAWKQLLKVEERTWLVSRMRSLFS